MQIVSTTIQEKIENHMRLCSTVKVPVNKSEHDIVLKNERFFQNKKGLKPEEITELKNKIKTIIHKIRTWIRDLNTDRLMCFDLSRTKSSVSMSTQFDIDQDVALKDEQLDKYRAELIAITEKLNLELCLKKGYQESYELLEEEFIRITSDLNEQFVNKNLKLIEKEKEAKELISEIENLSARYQICEKENCRNKIETQTVLNEVEMAIQSRDNLIKRFGEVENTLNKKIKNLEDRLIEMNLKEKLNSHEIISLRTELDSLRLEHDKKQIAFDYLEQKISDSNIALEKLEKQNLQLVEDLDIKNRIIRENEMESLVYDELTITQFIKEVANSIEFNEQLKCKQHIIKTLEIEKLTVTKEKNSELEDLCFQNQKLYRVNSEIRKENLILHSNLKEQSELIHVFIHESEKTYAILKIAQEQICKLDSLQREQTANSIEIRNLVNDKINLENKISKHKNLLAGQGCELRFMNHKLKKTNKEVLTLKTMLKLISQKNSEYKNRRNSILNKNVYLENRLSENKKALEKLEENNLQLNEELYRKEHTIRENEIENSLCHELILTQFTKEVANNIELNQQLKSKQNTIEKLENDKLSVIHDRNSEIESFYLKKKKLNSEIKKVQKKITFLKLVGKRSISTKPFLDKNVEEQEQINEFKQEKCTVGTQTNYNVDMFNQVNYCRKKLETLAQEVRKIIDSKRNIYKDLEKLLKVYVFNHKELEFIDNVEGKCAEREGETTTIDLATEKEDEVKPTLILDSEEKHLKVSVYNFDKNEISPKYEELNVNIAERNEKEYAISNFPYKFLDEISSKVFTDSEKSINVPVNSFQINDLKTKLEAAERKIEKLCILNTKLQKLLFQLVSANKII